MFQRDDFAFELSFLCYRICQVFWPEAECDLRLRVQSRCVGNGCNDGMARTEG